MTIEVPRRVVGSSCSSKLTATFLFFKDPLLNNEPLSGVSHPFYSHSSWARRCPNNECFVFLFTKSWTRTMWVLVLR